jgi:hypothetical protein
MPRTSPEQPQEAFIVPFPGLELQEGQSGHDAIENEGTADHRLDLIRRRWNSIPEEMKQAIVDAIQEQT